MRKRSKHGKVQKITDISTIAGEKTSNAVASTTQTPKLPSAGIERRIIAIVIILIVAMIIFKIKSRKIKY